MEKTRNFLPSSKQEILNMEKSVMIGLEIHGYINTEEKLFCSCKAIHGTKFAKPNTNICPICTAQPGSKPMLPNAEAVKKIIQIALILNCKINGIISHESNLKGRLSEGNRSGVLAFQRKHYDWPDLPKGYQNTISGKYANPVGVKGEFEGIRITEVHLEEDPAAWNPKTGEIDYNRSGSPLVEIVTEPDFTSSEQVVSWLKDLILTLSYIKAIDKNSGIKADVNVSLPKLNGKRIEIKNVNSLNNIKNAIEAEIIRQKKEGVAKVQETRRYNELKNITTKMRSKEQQEDYRFISEPDLPILKIEKTRIESIKKQLPETPKEKLSKLIKKHKIEKKHAEILTKKLEIVEFFEKVIQEIKPELAVPWTTTELLSVLNYNKKEIDEVEIFPEHFIELLKLVEKGEITELKAKDILRKFVPKSFSPKEHAKENKKISSENEIEKIAKQVIKQNSKAVEDYRSGKQEALNFLIGQVMKLSDKRADYKTAKEILVRELKK
jgi:aspartyl-tRNA(Asn)/glutamyl-tRNA(Gln) amidotransferase subunit B